MEWVKNLWKRQCVKNKINIDKENLEKKTGDVHKKTDVSGLVTAAFLKTKIREVEKQTPGD